MDVGPDQEHTVIIGAGPAGLTAALELGRFGRRVVVFEADAVWSINEEQAFHEEVRERSVPERRTRGLIATTRSGG